MPCCYWCKSKTIPGAIMPDVASMSTQDLEARISIIKALPRPDQDRPLLMLLSRERRSRLLDACIMWPPAGVMFVGM